MLAFADEKIPRILHPFAPVWFADSKVLILGTMPSPQSRARGFYYGHPQNRFWNVLAAIMEDAEPADISAKRDFLLRHHIALWDVLQSCLIIGAQDSSIRQPQVNDLGAILQKAPISHIFTNGQTAARLYRLYCQPSTGMPCLALPSTSPANGRYPLAALRESWLQVRQSLAAGSAKSP